MDDELIIEVVGASIDRAFYEFFYPDVAEAGVDPVVHYAYTGWIEGRDPAPWFSTEAYLVRYEDVARSGINPLVHYLLEGIREGRSVEKSRLSFDMGRGVGLSQTGVHTRQTPAAPAPQNNLAWEEQSIAAEMDESFYRGQLGAKGLTIGDMSIARHYLVVGAEMGLDPAPWFSTQDYLTRHRDVADSRLNPFRHYLTSGRDEGREIRDSSIVSSAVQAQEEIALIASEFDANFYMTMYPDVSASGVSPVEHFYHTGWRENRDPSLTFSTRNYLELYPDIVDAGMNPFLHYLQAGRAEGREPRSLLGYRYEILKSLKPLEQRLTDWHRNIQFDIERDRETLVVQAAALADVPAIYITVSHDNFRENTGGVQLCVDREVAAAEAAGFDSIHLFPAQPMPVVNDDPDYLCGVSIKGQKPLYVPARDLAEILPEALSAVGNVSAAIHSLLGHNPEMLLEVLGTLSLRQRFFWVHDYASICAGFTLLRNDVEYCGAPTPTSGACRICTYGSRRMRQIEAHKLMLETLSPMVLAPSETAAAIWDEWHGEWPAKVHHHAKLELLYKSELAVGPRMKIGFLGYPAYHKGWGLFRELVLKYRDDPRYEFIHLGKRPHPELGIAFREVQVSEQDSAAMSRAVAEERIDLAVMWSIWPETFCIAAHEAYAGGATILTHADSGHVADLAGRTEGMICISEAEVYAAFEGDAVRDLLEAAGEKTIRRLEFSKMAADFLEGVDA